ncbi:hypothetical protein ACI3ER_11595 [Bacillus sp. Wb]
MKKTFIVEVEYEELEENVKNNADVFYDTGLEVAVENLLYGYTKTNSIGKQYEVNVTQI